MSSPGLTQTPRPHADAERSAAPETVTASPSPLPLPAAPAPPSRRRRALLWGALLALMGVAQTLLVTLTVGYESVRAQEETDAVATEAAAEIRHLLTGTLQALQTLGWKLPPEDAARRSAADLLRQQVPLKRIEWRDAKLQVQQALDTPFPPALFTYMARSSLGVEAEVACAAARRAGQPMFSRSYFVPQADALGQELMDVCIPLQREGVVQGYLVATWSLGGLLEASPGAQQARRHAFAFVEADGTRLARAGMRRGAGVFVSDRLVDMPGATLQLRVDSVSGRPSLIPNLATGLVLGLSFALFGVALLLARDVRRRARVERELAEALTFRKAMEDSLSTGLRARDMAGVITYVNPAFCQMVGFSADQLLGRSDLETARLAPPPPAAGMAGAPPDGGNVEPAPARPSREATPPYTPPYWPPERIAEYHQRQAIRLEGKGRSPGEPREGYETVFMRQNGERFPVMIYETPLLDGRGEQTGWMSAVLDLSAQRRVEELSRQQQDRLQATARLATIGEMASLLSHELNQPLAAIASYATGSLNLMDDPAPDTPGQLRSALERIAEQAERAGRVIKSVHGFVRRREQLHETLGADLLLEAVLPLVRMHSRKSATRIDVDLPPGEGGRGVRSPRVRCDRTMVEQVLLNLARNGIQAMEGDTPVNQRVLTLRVREATDGAVTFSVIDRGPGISPEVAERVFTPFFTTRAEGMGLGLSLCRTVAEQHGGSLDFGPAPDGQGTEFRFTLPPLRRGDRAEVGDTAGPAAAERSQR